VREGGREVGRGRGGGREGGERERMKKDKQYLI